MDKLELNDKLAELYGLEPFTMIGSNIPAIENSAIMFDLMIEHNLLPTFNFVWLNLGDIDEKYYTVRLKNEMGATDMIFVKDHETEREAALYAIALKLVKLAESKL